MGNNAATLIQSAPKIDEGEDRRSSSYAGGHHQAHTKTGGRNRPKHNGVLNANDEGGAQPSHQTRQKIKLSETEADFFNSRTTFIYQQEAADDILPTNSWDQLQIGSSSLAQVDAISSVSLVVGLNYTDTAYPLQGAHEDAHLFSLTLEQLGFQIRRANGSTVDFFATLDSFAAEIATGHITRDATICIGFFGHTTQVSDADALVFTDALLTEADLRHAISRPEFEYAQITIILDTSLVWSSSSQEYKWPPRDTHLRPPPPSRAFTKRFVPISKVRLRTVGPSIFNHPRTPVDLIVFTPSATVNQNAIELVAHDNVVRGAFTHALCIVLREKVRLDGGISYESLLLAVREQLWAEVGEINFPTLTATKATSITRPVLNFTPPSTSRGGPCIDFSRGKIATHTTESFGSHGVSGDSVHSTCSSSGRQDTRGEDSVRRRGEYQDYEHSMRASDNSHAPSEYSRRGPALSHHYEFDHTGLAPSPSHHTIRTLNTPTHSQILQSSHSMRSLESKHNYTEHPSVLTTSYSRHASSHFAPDPRYDPTLPLGSVYSQSISRHEGGGWSPRGRRMTDDRRYDPTLPPESIYSQSISRHEGGWSPRGGDWRRDVAGSVYSQNIMSRHEGVRSPRRMTNDRRYDGAESVHSQSWSRHEGGRSPRGGDDRRFDVAGSVHSQSISRHEGMRSPRGDGRNSICESEKENVPYRDPRERAQALSKRAGASDLPPPPPPVPYLDHTM